MKTFIIYLLLVSLASMSGCKTRHTGFIKSTKEQDVTLSSVASPYIIFVLENKDTINFGRQDIVNLIDERLAKEVKRIGYLSSKHLAELRESLRNVNTDTIVFQNLSAVGIMTISDNLDGWIARELLLNGKAAVALRGDRKPIDKLKYVYVRDVLGGEQGSFYTTDNRLVYQTIISLGE
ncbi:MAG: hypothetical protein EOO46_15565 [Flavobacterium sp.]|nr:MAG: hypothetical protein EOO46_15565 [Flavobacterium sp.]